MQALRIAQSLLDLTHSNNTKFNDRGFNRVTLHNIVWRKSNPNLIAFLAKGHESYSNPQGYIVAIKCLGTHLKILADDVKVACSCPAYHWWGVKYNATQGDYNYKTRTSIEPNIRDKERQNKLCKHIVAIYPKVRGKSVEKFNKGRPSTTENPQIKTRFASENHISEIDFNHIEVIDSMLSVNADYDLELANRDSYFEAQINAFLSQ